MNLVLLFEEDFAQDPQRVRLSGRRLAHVREIHRAEVGDELCVGLLGGRIGSGKVLALDENGIELAVEFDRAPPAALPVTLVLALPRPLVLKRVLIAATSLGVKRILLVNAGRVEKSYWQSHAMTDAAIREQLLLGLEQARDTRLPDVGLRKRFRPFVEDELPSLLPGKLGLVAHPGGGPECPRGVDREVVLAVGPEGGWSDHEISALQECGLRAVGLGERILRVETAIPALLARIF